MSKKLAHHAEQGFKRRVESVPVLSFAGSESIIRSSSCCSSVQKVFGSGSCIAEVGNPTLVGLHLLLEMF